MRHQLLIIILTALCCINSVFGQDSIDPKLLLGKWKIDIMRDRADNAIDIASASDTTMPDILPYLTFKTKKVLLQCGKSKWKGKWHIKDKRLVIDTENNTSLSYLFIALTNNVLTIEHTLIMSNDEKITLKIFYKKI